VPIRFSLAALYLMWCFIGTLVLTRVLYILLLPLCGMVIVVMIWRLPRDVRTSAILSLWPHVLIPPLAVIGLLGLINYIKFGDPLLSGYHQWQPERHLPTGPMSEGLYGLLLAPRFSVFLYFPILAFAVLG